MNPYQKKIRRTLWDVLLWRSGYYNDKQNINRAPDSFVYPLPLPPFDPAKPQALWLNHSSFLIRFGNKALLTDPIWSERCSPFPFLGPKRRHEPALEVEKLPKIDYVLISHNHYDHLDHKTVEYLFASHPEILWLVPTGVKKWFQKRGITRVIEKGWWEEAEIDPQIIATCVPTQHFSGRSLRDQNKTLWCGWVIHDQKENKKLYFVGDTGYNGQDFKEIGKRFAPMDLSLIPIGSYIPRRFMSPVHIEPADAVKIHQEVGSKLSIAMHWKTFRLSDEPMEQPPYDLYLAVKEKNINPLAFIAPEPGIFINW